MASATAIAALAAESRVARLATVDDTGYPHLVPVCYATDRQTYYSALDAKTKRLPPERLRRGPNNRANPKVALLFRRYEEDWRQLCYVMVQGEAELLSTGPEWETARGLLTAKYPQYGTMPLDPRGLMIKIVPQRVVSWSAAR